MPISRPKLDWTEVHLVPQFHSNAYRIFDTHDETHWFRVYIDLERTRLIFSLGLFDERGNKRKFQLISKTELAHVSIGSVEPFVTDALIWAENKLKSPMEMLVDDLNVGFRRKVVPTSY